MKKIFLFYLSLFIFITAKANEVGHFFVDLSSQNVSVANISTSFSNYVNVASGSTFALFRDTTDGLGIRHQSYQQYYQGSKVQSNIVIVHSMNGIVKCINGAVMTNTAKPTTAPVRISRRQAAAKAPVAVADSSVSEIFYCLDGIYHRVYKVPSPKTFETLYIDITTGEIIYRESAFRNADVVGHGYTRYNGWQNMTVYESDGKYFLMDEGRNMVTMSAENVSPNTNYYMSESYILTLPENIINELPYLSPEMKKEIIYQYVMTPMMNDYIQNSCASLYSEGIDIYTPRIKSITISSATSSWWYDIWDTKPDLYCQICDANGNVLYTTNTKDDCTLPVTFTFSKGIAVNKGCIIKIYDEDATSDSYGEGVTLTSVTPGTKTWSSSNTSGSIVIIDSPVEYADIHWGMQKTLDFYKAIFNRNSFDGKGHEVINLAFPPYDKQVFPTMPNNAAAQSDYEPYFMFYGWGDGVNMNPVVSLDVMAHEFTHMVTGTNGNGGLDYKLESGALNESFSDIMAMGVMQYTLGNCPWTIGEDVMVNAPNMRSMTNPKNSQGANGDTLKGAQPDTYKGQCWSYIPATIDTNQVVVHRNSGVQNYWFYLLSEGGRGANDCNDSYSVEGIGMNKALQIAFRNLLFYLAPCATFEDSRNGSIQAAIDLYGKDSQEYKSVIDAWYAVGVGEATGKFITIKAQVPSDWGTTISAWVWEDGKEGKWATLARDGEWYSYTTSISPLNIVFVNGSTWAGETNQSVDISITESTCIQLDDNKSGKRSYIVIDCDPEPDNVIHLPYNEPFTSNIGQFNIVNVNLGGLNYVWQWASANYGMKASAYVNNKNNVTESWLVSPPISLRNINTATLAFEHAVNKGTTNNLKVLITTDPSSEKWYNLDIPNWPAGTNWTFVPTSVSLDQYIGKIVQIAFVYVSTSSDCPTWEVKNFSVTGTEVASQLVNNPKDANVAAKYIRDGQLFILRDGKTYSIQGVEVK